LTLALAGGEWSISVLNILNHKERRKGNRSKVDEKEKNNGVHSFEMLSVRLIHICLDAEYSRHSHTVLSTELIVRTNTVYFLNVPVFGLLFIPTFFWTLTTV
jgi:hypothetical protein